jgi:putative ABC transporter-associated repeat protein
MSDRTRTRTRALRRLGLAAAAAALSAGTSAGSSYAVGHGLDQQIERDQALVEGRAVLERGHVDVGPRLVDGTWTLLVHDDAAKADPAATSAWRRPEDVVLRVGDAARLEVPDDPAYAFLGAAPGSPVHVVPQTQNPDVVWVGWNTQDPEVMRLIDRGVTLGLGNVRGPGELLVYLQSGSFGAPEVLWDSRRTQAQPVWVDVNTHTHANWVFTEPGVYSVELTVSADTVDGRTVSDTRALRFAVGDGTDPREAWAAPAEEPSPRPTTAGDETSPAPSEASGDPVATPAAVSDGDAADGTEQREDTEAVASAEGNGPGAGVLVSILVAAAAVLFLLVGLVLRRGREAKRQALRQGGS